MTIRADDSKLYFVVVKDISIVEGHQSFTFSWMVPKVNELSQGSNMDLLDPTLYEEDTSLHEEWLPIEAVLFVWYSRFSIQKPLADPLLEDSDQTS